MINRLGWKTDQHDCHSVSDNDSECSVHSLTGADQAELDDFFSFLSMEDVTTDDSLLNADSDCSSDCSDGNTILAPPFSPIPSTENEPILDVENPENNQQELTTEILAPCNDDSMSVDGRVWNGFKLVGDNIDKNYRQSFNRMDKKTTSIHYFHYYAVRDRIDLSACSEAQPTASIDVQKLIVDTDDLAMLNDDVIVLMSRLSYM